ncbi:MAG: ankyrin repeat domain-containing protein [Stenotrophobium sp.]
MTQQRLAKVADSPETATWFEPGVMAYPQPANSDGQPPSDDQPPPVWAAVRGNIPAITMAWFGSGVMAYSQPANSDGQPPSDDQPPLVWAAVRGNIPAIEALLDHGAEIDQEGPAGGNALAAAILNQQVDTVDLLIRHGANINMTYSGSLKGLRPIVLAARAGNVGILNRLISRGAEVNFKPSDPDQATALHEALVHEQFAAARRLLDAGATPNLSKTPNEN